MFSDFSLTILNFISQDFDPVSVYCLLYQISKTINITIRIKSVQFQPTAEMKREEDLEEADVKLRT